MHNREHNNKKVGSAFKYGMTHELPAIIRDNGMGNAVHLYASLVYLSLNNIVDPKKISMLPRMIFVESSSKESLKKVVEIVSNIVVDQVKGKFDFTNFEELQDQMDQYSIPDWCFTYAEDFLKHYIENMIFFHNELYFIGKRDCDTENSLLRINVGYLGKNPELIENAEIERLASGFNEVLGFDDKLQRIYLKLYSQRNSYAYYDILTDKVVIGRNRFHSVVSGNLFVITRDDYLAMLIDDTEYCISKYKEYENYEARADYFMVKPNNSGDRFFYPYYLYFDGRKVPAEKSECEKILWEYMTQRLKEPKLSYFDNGVSSKKAALPHKFSMNGITETLDFIIPKEKQCRSKDFVLIKNIFGILELYLDKDTDITGLLYSLCEASSELNPSIGFPSEKLYWRLKELQLENEDADMSLSMLIHDHNYGLLIKKLTNETFDNEKIEQSVENNSSVKNVTYDPWKSEYERDHIDGNGGMIGTFSVYADGLKTSPVSLEEGIFLGDQIIPRVNFPYETGIVTYDARTRMHYITCEHDITCEQKLQIIKDFDIDEDMVSVIKQGLPRTKRRRKTGLEQGESTCAAG